MLRFYCWFLLAFASLTSHAEEAAVLRCFAVEDVADRIDCYDTIARSILDRQVASEDIPKKEVAAKSEPAKPTTDKQSDFGKKPEKAKPAADAATEVRTIITSVTKSASGRRVMTLANGQIWMEDEPGRQRVKPDQEITITRQRWRYVMSMASGPIVPVHRVN